MTTTDMKTEASSSSAGISPLLSQLTPTLTTRTASSVIIAAAIFTETGPVKTETIAEPIRVTALAMRIGIVRIARNVLTMKMINAMIAANALRNAVTVITNVRAAAKNAILFATVAKKNAANVPPMKCVLNAVNTARIVWIPCGATPVSYVSDALITYVKAARRPAPTVHIFAKIAKSA